MNIHGPNYGQPLGRVDLAHRTERSRLEATAPGVKVTTESSPAPSEETGALFSQLRDLPDIREGLLPELASKIQSGEYNTRISAERLADAILEQARLG